jgi:hypothetical protein
VKPASSVSPADPSRELQLLKRARARVRSEPSAALALVGQHEHEFAHGLFVEEREVIAVDALLASGARPRAEQRAARFYARYPQSIHAQRIRALLAQDALSDKKSPASSHARDVNP